MGELELESFVGRKADARADETLPKYFNWNDKKPECINKVIKNQANCGSCYTFASSNALADRACMKYGYVGASFSAQMLLSCTDTTKSGTYGNKGCNGGNYY